MRRLVTLLWGCVRRSVREDLASGGRQEDGEAKDARLGAHSQPDLQRTVHSLYNLQAARVYAKPPCASGS